MQSMCSIACFGMTCFTLCVLYGWILPSSTPQYIVWITMGFSLGVGAGLAYGVYNWPKAGIICIGLVVGSFIGSLIYIVFLSNYTGNMKLVLDMNTGASSPTTRPFSEIQSEELRQLWICIMSCALVFSGLAAYFYEQAMIQGTCIVGSYLFIRGVSLIIGGFPNEFLLFDSLENATLLDQSNIFFLYVIAILLLSIFSIQKQLKLRDENIQLNEYKKYDFSFRSAYKDQQKSSLKKQFRGDPTSNHFLSDNEKEGADDECSGLM